MLRNLFSHTLNIALYASACCIAVSEVTENEKKEVMETVIQEREQIREDEF